MFQRKLRSDHGESQSLTILAKNILKSEIVWKIIEFKKNSPWNC